MIINNASGVWSTCDLIVEAVGRITNPTPEKTLIDPTPFLNGVPTFSFKLYPVPDRIIRNEDATVVMWKDGTKTIVHRAEGTEDSPYAAFTAALAIKCYGSNSAVNRIVRKTEQQKSKAEKAEEKKRKKTLKQLPDEAQMCMMCKHINVDDINVIGGTSALWCKRHRKYVFPDKCCKDFDTIICEEEK